MARNWIIGAEYAYYNFGSENYAFAIVGPIGLVTAADFDFHTVKAKAAYRW
jgi:opacity protein-like surface antigen